MKTAMILCLCAMPMGAQAHHHAGRWYDHPLGAPYSHALPGDTLDGHEQTLPNGSVCIWEYQRGDHRCIPLNESKYRQHYERGVRSGNATAERGIERGLPVGDRSGASGAGSGNAYGVPAPSGPCPDPTQTRLATGHCYGDGKRLDGRNSSRSSSRDGDHRGPSDGSARPGKR